MHSVATTYLVLKGQHSMHKLDVTGNWVLYVAESRVASLVLQVVIEWGAGATRGLLPSKSENGMESCLYEVSGVMECSKW